MAVLFPASGSRQADDLDCPHAESPAVRRQSEHLGGPVLLLADRRAHGVDHLGSVLALCARPSARLDVRRHDPDVRHAVHDGGRLHAVEERPRARRRAVQLLPAAHAGDHRPHSLHRLFPARHFCADLRRLFLRRRFGAHPRAFGRDRGWPARVPVQGSDSAGGRVPAGAGHRRDHPLHRLHSPGRLALARAGRPGSRRRQAERDGAREG